MAGQWKFYCSTHEASMPGLVNEGGAAPAPTMAATTTTSG